MKNNYNLLPGGFGAFLPPPEKGIRLHKSPVALSVNKGLLLAMALLCLLNVTQTFAQSGETCATAIDLGAQTSPYSSTTIGATNDYNPSCHGDFSGPDLVYSIVVPNGYTITIGQTVNDNNGTNYDSVHSVYYGTCTSQTLVKCTDDPDTLEDGPESQVRWENTTGIAQTIYWYQDGYNVDTAGTFTLAWTLTPPPECNVPMAVLATLTSPTVANLSWNVPNTGTATGYEYAVTNTALPPASGAATTARAITGVPVTVNQPSYLHVRSKCGANSYSSWVTYPFYSGVCIPAPLYSNGAGITNVNIGSIYNTTTYLDSFYGNYGSQIVNIGQGVIQQFSVTLNVYNSYNLKIWVDWNDNLIFDENEEMYSGVSQDTENALLTGSFTVPATATLGNHRLRIGAVPDTDGPATPCYTGSYGTFEDYTVNVTVPPTCYTPTSLTTTNTGPGIVSISWTAPAQGTAPAGYQYALDTTVAAPASGITATGTTVTGAVTPVNVVSYLHVRSSCGGGNFSEWVTTSLYNGVCIPDIEYFGGNGIVNFTTGTINNTTEAEEGNYGNYSSQVVNIGQGVTQPFSIGLDASGSYNTKIWVDWNNDLDFDDEGEEVYDTDSPERPFATLNGTFVVPLNAAMGNHRLRIGIIDINSAPVTPCFSGYYAAFEDYTVNVIAAPSCYTPVNVAAVNVALGKANISWSAPTNGPAPAGYQYAVTTTATPPSTGASTTTTTALNVTVTANAINYIHVRTNCSGGDFSLWYTIPYYNGYCTPAPSYIDDGGVTNVTIRTINNTTGAEAGNYGDYSAQAATIGQGVTSQFSIGFTSYNAYNTKIWVDWNNDLDFDDDGEEVFSGLSAGESATLTGSFTVPINATIGNHRLRIGVAPNFSDDPVPCSTAYYGAYEDYTINVTTPPSCFAPVNFAAQSTASGIATLTWSMPSYAGTPVGYQYAVTATGTPPANGTTASASTVTGVAVTANATSYLHVRANCGNNDFSEWVTISFYNGVCIPEPEYMNGDGITNVNIGSINNTTSGEEGYYGNYSAQIVNVGQGVTQPFSISLFTYDAANVILWADFNDDLDFDDEGELIYSGTSQALARSILTGTFTIPATAPLGNHRLRIVASPGYLNDPTPCNVDGAGTYEDYTINVTVPPTCPTPLNAIGVIVSQGTVNLSWSRPSTGGIPAGYEYVVDTNNVTLPASGTFVAGTSVTNYTGLTDNTYYYLHVRTSCGSGNFSEWITSARFKYLQGDTCETAINLTTQTSPYTSTTQGADDNFTGTCNASGGAPDLFYYVEVPNGYTITIGLTNNGYDSAHTVFHGTCANYTTLICTDEESGDTIWENTSGTTKKVYWVQDGWGTNFGNFTLAWTLTPPVTCDKPRALDVDVTSLTTVNINWNVPNTGTPVGYEYAVTQSNTAPASGTFTTVTSATGVAISPNVDSYLYVRTICSDADGNSEWVNLPFFSGYCVPKNTEYTSYYITGINTTGAETNFSNTDTTFSAYTDYTSQYAVSSYPGGSFAINATTPNTTDDFIFSVWVDWNHNYNFSDEGERMFSTRSITTPASLGNLTIPNNTALGSYRMRIRNSHIGSPVPACGDAAGEAEDYLLNIVGPPSCFPPYNLRITPEGSGFATLNWSIPELGNPVAGYEYVFSTTATTPAGAGTPTSTFYAENVSYDPAQSVYLFVRSTCGAGQYSAWATVPLLGTDSPEFLSNNVIVYKEANTINITSGNALMTGVTIYDVRGSKLYSQTDINATETAINGLQIQQQVVIVEVTTAKGKVSKRIVF